MKPSKKNPSRDSHEDRLKKKPMKRRLDDDDDEDAIGMIRKMFGFVSATIIFSPCFNDFMSCLDMN